MGDVPSVLAAFVLGGLAGLGFLYSSGDLDAPPPPPPPPVVATLTPPEPPPPPVPTPVEVPKPEPTPPPEPEPEPVPEPPPVAEPPPPPAPEEAKPAFGRLVLAGIGKGALSVHAGKALRGAKVVVPLNKPDGEVRIQTPGGAFTLEVRYRAGKGGLKASIDCTPMALLGANGDMNTHQSVELGRAPLKLDINGGEAGSYSLLMQYQK